VILATMRMALGAFVFAFIALEGFAQGPAGVKPTTKKNSVRPDANGPTPIKTLVREYKSKNFLLHTDLSSKEVTELLNRLETMLRLISRYYGKPNLQPIEINVVQDLKNWSEGSIPTEVISKIERREGITLSATRGERNGLGQIRITAAKSIVWAVADRGTPQHEAVHAYCHQAFGRTGPTWYAEGMAELGQYWRENDESVQIHEGVLHYLQSEKPKRVTEITASGQSTGDGWQNYAWRWALCHLLAVNRNYRDRFKPLGLALLNDQPTSFLDVYGSMTQEINFEFEFFLKHLCQGYRVDLCGWDWKTKFNRLRGSNTAHVKIEAGRGWQASRIAVRTGDRISFTAVGEWTLAKEGKKLSAAGDSTGLGKLDAILLDDYVLSKPFEWGESGTFISPSEGHLYLRCHDDWSSISDNSGAVNVTLQMVN